MLDSEKGRGGKWDSLGLVFKLVFLPLYSWIVPVHLYDLQLNLATL
jgi:hypothetical protein